MVAEVKVSFPPPRVTEAEFLSLPESKEHVELIDGEVIVAPSPRFHHQVVVLRLANLLSQWAASHPPAFVGLSPFDVRLGPNRILQPDLFVLTAGVTARETPLTVVPDLIAEVLSYNRNYDRITKRTVYAEAGVKEYWLIEPEERWAERVLPGGALERHEGRLDSVACPGLVLDVASLTDAGLTRP